MTFAEEILVYLEGQGLGTRGTSLFMSFHPETESAATIATVKDSGGVPPPIEKAWPQAGLQVMVRAVDVDTAKRHAAKIYNLLHGMVHIDLTHHHILTSEATDVPHYVLTDAVGRVEVTANYTFEMYALTDSGLASSGYGGDKSPDSFT